MALQKSIVLDSGVTLPNGYIKISGINLTYNDSVVILIETYMDQQSFLDGKKPVSNSYKTCVDHKEGVVQNGKMTFVWKNDYTDYFDLSLLNQIDNNVIKQGYIYLKTLSDYADAIDILD